ncbi:unnamed protein product [Echinostoma caproni]|uniref:DNAJC9 HTH domain-containing protein n=1 Tax=Echinostoma caproni TaxID=27848 RepID=A0A3P8INH7_9TREM|nr:unnamed protein product [Echinostoma caproni]
MSKVYSLLADPEKRIIYDETGAVDDEDTFGDKTYEDWVQYWRQLFPPITTNDIDNFFAKYRNSEEELNDLVNVYERSKGDMDVIMERMILASHEEEERICGLVNQLIKDGRVQAYDAFVNEDPKKTARRNKRAANEKKMYEAEKKKQRKSVSSSGENEAAGMESLMLALRANREKQASNFDNLMDRLSEKYCKPSKSAKGKQSTKRSRK